MREGLVADIACERRDIAEELDPAQERRSDDREGKGSPSLPDLDATEQPKTLPSIAQALNLFQNPSKDISN